MINTQQWERPTKGPLVSLVRIWRTMQGEGPFAGHPAVFIRLAGCNFQCPMCDTDYTTGRYEATVEEVSRNVSEVGKLDDIVVITGGEPFRQYRVHALVRELSWNHHVQIETNGTYRIGEEMDEATVVCSPKSPRLHPDNFRFADSWIGCFKYILDAEHVSDEDGLPTAVLGMNWPIARPPDDFPRSNIYVQPADAGNSYLNDANVQAALASCMKFGYRLSLQTHKILGVD